MTASALPRSLSAAAAGQPSPCWSLAHTTQPPARAGARCCSESKLVSTWLGVDLPACALPGPARPPQLAAGAPSRPCWRPRHGPPRAPSSAFPATLPWPFQTLPVPFQSHHTSTSTRLRSFAAPRSSSWTRRPGQQRSAGLQPGQHLPGADGWIPRSRAATARPPRESAANQQQQRCTARRRRWVFPASTLHPWLADASARAASSQPIAIPSLKARPPWRSAHPAASRRGVRAAGRPHPSSRPVLPSAAASALLRTPEPRQANPCQPPPAPARATTSVQHSTRNAIFTPGCGRRWWAGGLPLASAAAAGGRDTAGGRGAENRARLQLLGCRRPWCTLTAALLQAATAHQLPSWHSR
jgi:hypothetical protein